MIPKSINPAHVLLAIEEINKDGVPPRRHSYQYDLSFGVNRYPPKLVISIAARFATGQQLNRGFNAVEAKNRLIRLGFVILDKSVKTNQARMQVVSGNEESTFAEGRAKFRRHKALERDSKLIK